jgi:hypothetical protein
LTLDTEATTSTSARHIAASTPVRPESTSIAVDSFIAFSSRCGERCEATDAEANGVADRISGPANVSYKRRVLDRTELILEIFAQRARTSEGKVQVELAQLEHLFDRSNFFCHDVRS